MHPGYISPCIRQGGMKEGWEKRRKRRRFLLVFFPPCIFFASGQSDSSTRDFKRREGIFANKNAGLIFTEHKTVAFLSRSLLFARKKNLPFFTSLFGILPIFLLSSTPASICLLTGAVLSFLYRDVVDECPFSPFFSHST